MRKILISYLLAAWLLPALAHAQRYYVARQSGGFGGANEISTQLGFQAGLGGSTPGGFKFFFDYSRRLGKVVWLNFKVNPTFGVGRTRADCYDSYNGVYYDCSQGFDGDGYAIDLLVGAKFKWLISRIHLMPYCEIDGGVIPVFSRPRDDNGAAVAIYTGGGLKYFVTPHVGLGLEVAVTLGPGFYDHHTEFYRAFNLATGAEFVF